VRLSKDFQPGFSVRRLASQLGCIDGLRGSSKGPKGHSMNEGVASDALVATVTDAPAHRSLASLYAGALRANLAETTEGALRRAYEIGRQGFAQGLGILELVAMHHEALATLSTRDPRSAALPQQIVRAGEFLAE